MHPHAPQLVIRVSRATFIEAKSFFVAFQIGGRPAKKRTEVVVTPTATPAFTRNTVVFDLQPHDVDGGDGQPLRLQVGTFIGRRGDGVTASNGAGGDSLPLTPRSWPASPPTSPAWSGGATPPPTPSFRTGTSRYGEVSASSPPAGRPPASGVLFGAAVVDLRSLLLDIRGEGGPVQVVVKLRRPPKHGTGSGGGSGGSGDEGSSWPPGHMDAPVGMVVLEVGLRLPTGAPTAAALVPSGTTQPSDAGNPAHDAHAPVTDTGMAGGGELAPSLASYLHARAHQCVPPMRSHTVFGHDGMLAPSHPTALLLERDVIIPAPALVLHDPLSPRPPHSLLVPSAMWRDVQRFATLAAMCWRDRQRAHVPPFVSRRSLSESDVVGEEMWHQLAAVGVNVDDVPLHHHHWPFDNGGVVTRALLQAVNEDEVSVWTSQRLSDSGDVASTQVVEGATAAPPAATSPRLPPAAASTMLTRTAVCRLQVHKATVRPMGGMPVFSEGGAVTRFRVGACFATMEGVVGAAGHVVAVNPGPWSMDVSPSVFATHGDVEGATALCDWGDVNLLMLAPYTPHPTTPDHRHVVRVMLLHMAPPGAGSPDHSHLADEGGGGEGEAVVAACDVDVTGIPAGHSVPMRLQWGDPASSDALVTLSITITVPVNSGHAAWERWNALAPATTAVAPETNRSDDATTVGGGGGVGSKVDDGGFESRGLTCPDVMVGLLQLHVPHIDVAVPSMRSGSVGTYSSSVEAGEWDDLVVSALVDAVDGMAGACTQATWRTLADIAGRESAASEGMPVPPAGMDATAVLGALQPPCPSPSFHLEACLINTVTPPTGKGHRASAASAAPLDPALAPRGGAAAGGDGWQAAGVADPWCVLPVLPGVWHHDEAMETGRHHHADWHVDGRAVWLQHARASMQGRMGADLATGMSMPPGHGVPYLSGPVYRSGRAAWVETISHIHTGQVDGKDGSDSEGAEEVEVWRGSVEVEGGAAAAPTVTYRLHFGASLTIPVTAHTVAQVTHWAMMAGNAIAAASPPSSEASTTPAGSKRCTLAVALRLVMTFPSPSTAASIVVATSTLPLSSLLSDHWHRGGPPLPLSSPTPSGKTNPRTLLPATSFMGVSKPGQPSSIAVRTTKATVMVPEAAVLVDAISSGSGGGGGGEGNPPDTLPMPCTMMSLTLPTTALTVAHAHTSSFVMEAVGSGAGSSLTFRLPSQPDRSHVDGAARSSDVELGGASGWGLTVRWWPIRPTTLPWVVMPTTPDAALLLKAILHPMPITAWRNVRASTIQTLVDVVLPPASVMLEGDGYYATVHANTLVQCDGAAGDVAQATHVRVLAHVLRCLPAVVAACRQEVAQVCAAWHAHHPAQPAPSGAHHDVAGYESGSPLMSSSRISPFTLRGDSDGEGGGGGSGALPSTHPPADHGPPPIMARVVSMHDVISEATPPIVPPLRIAAHSVMSAPEPAPSASMALTSRTADADQLQHSSRLLQPAAEASGLEPASWRLDRAAGASASALAVCGDEIRMLRAALAAAKAENAHLVQQYADAARQREEEDDAIVAAVVAGVADSHPAPPSHASSLASGRQVAPSPQHLEHRCTVLARRYLQQRAACAALTAQLGAVQGELELARAKLVAAPTHSHALAHALLGKKTGAPGRLGMLAPHAGGRGAGGVPADGGPGWLNAKPSQPVLAMAGARTLLPVSPMHVTASASHLPTAGGYPPHASLHAATGVASWLGGDDSTTQLGGPPSTSRTRTPTMVSSSASSSGTELSLDNDVTAALVRAVGSSSFALIPASLGGGAVPPPRPAGHPVGGTSAPTLESQTLEALNAGGRMLWDSAPRQSHGWRQVDVVGMDAEVLGPMTAGVMTGAVPAHIPISAITHARLLDQHAQLMAQVREARAAAAGAASELAKVRAAHTTATTYIQTLQAGLAKTVLMKSVLASQQAQIVKLESALARVQGGHASWRPGRGEGGRRRGDGAPMRHPSPTPYDTDPGLAVPSGSDGEGAGAGTRGVAGRGRRGGAPSHRRRGVTFAATTTEADEMERDALHAVATDPSAGGEYVRAMFDHVTSAHAAAIRSDDRLAAALHHLRHRLSGFMLTALRSSLDRQARLKSQMEADATQYALQVAQLQTRWATQSPAHGTGGAGAVGGGDALHAITRALADTSVARTGRDRGGHGASHAMSPTPSSPYRSGPPGGSAPAAPSATRPAGSDRMANDHAMLRALEELLSTPVPGMAPTGVALAVQAGGASQRSA